MDWRSLLLVEVNTLDNKLREAFSQYFETATSNLRGTGQLHCSSTLLETNGAELRQLVAELERGDIFARLVTETINSAEQLNRIPFIIADAFLADLTEWSVGSAVGTFFRRSECYLKLFEDKPVDIELLFESYKNAFRETEVQTRYLAALGFVDFGVQSLCLLGISHSQILGRGTQ
jgi:hypothetical protein